MKSARQPYAGARRRAIELARKPPSGMHTMVSVTAKGRCRRGTYSDASVAALGMAPPRPMPAMNRSTPSAKIEFDESDGDREDGKREDAAEQRRATAVAVAEHAAGQSADHHPERARWPARF